MEEHGRSNGQGQRRPRVMTLLGGVYLFFFLLTFSSFGQPVPFFGTIVHGRTAAVLVFVDTLICLYLFLGIMKRQSLTWHLLLGYNTLELANTLTNLLYLSPADLEKITGGQVDSTGLLATNIIIITAIILLSCAIFLHRNFFTNRSKYLF